MGGACYYNSDSVPYEATQRTVLSQVLFLEFLFKFFRGHFRFVHTKTEGVNLAFKENQTDTNFVA